MTIAAWPNILEANDPPGVTIPPHYCSYYCLIQYRDCLDWHWVRGEAPTQRSPLFNTYSRFSEVPIFSMKDNSSNISIVAFSAEAFQPLYRPQYPTWPSVVLDARILLAWRIRLYSLLRVSCCCLVLLHQNPEHFAGVGDKCFCTLENYGRWYQ